MKEPVLSSVARAWTRLAVALVVVLSLGLGNATNAFASGEDNYPHLYAGYAQWTDDDNPGRVYDDDKRMNIVYSDGTIYYCVPYGDAENYEAVIYGIDEGTNYRDIEIPETLNWADGTYTVVGLVSNGDVFGYDDLSDYDYYSETDHRAKYRISQNGFVTGVTIPGTVRFIGKGAFNGWTSITSVSFAESEEPLTIEAGAFANCKNLAGTDDTSTLTLPDRVTYVGVEAFINCPSLTNVEFPAYADIDCNVFHEGADSLTSIVNAPANLYFYEDASQLWSVSFSPSLEAVEGIENAPQLSSVYLPEGVRAIKGSAFNDLPSLQTINFPSSLIFIGACAFHDDVSLWEIQGYPGNVQYVGGGAFGGCTSLAIDAVHPGELSDQYEHSGVKSITFAASGTNSAEVIAYGSYWEDHHELVRETFVNYGNDPDWEWESRLHAYWFDGCTNLSAFYVIDGSTDTVWAEDGVLYSKTFHAGTIGFPGSNNAAGVTDVLVKYPAAKSGGSYTVPSFVKAVGPRAFSDCSFDEIHIPVTVEWMLADFENSEEEATPFTGMANEPTVYYVKNSWVESAFTQFRYERNGETWRAGSYDHGTYYGPVATEAGPQVEIVYSMDGGINNPNNPTAVQGGSEVTLLAPTREGRAFTGWARKLSEDDFEEIPDNVLAPRNEELVNGVVTVEPYWSTLSIENATITLSETSFVYDGKEKTPAVTVTLGDETLEEDTDYTVAYSDNVAAGTATVTVTGAGAYSDSETTVTFVIAKAKQAISASAKTVAMGKTVSLGTKRTAGDGRLTYKSSNTKVATVSSAGVVTPKGAGKATVTITAAATANYAAATKTVTVTVTKGTQAISASGKTVKTGKTVSLGAKLTTGGGKLTYKSSDTTVATVSAKGVVTGKNVGTAKITIMAAGTASWNRATRTVTVKVTAQSGTWKGSGSKWWYQWADGNYPRSQFLTISGKTYYFDAGGYCVYGWRQISGKYYYFESSGAMARSKWVGNYWLGADGVMATNAWVDGGRYWVGADGAWVKGKTR